jgi:hypothetical protein
MVAKYSPVFDDDIGELVDRNKLFVVFDHLFPAEVLKIFSILFRRTSQQRVGHRLLPGSSETSPGPHRPG